MYGIFVNSDGISYADAIVKGYKTIETRYRDVFKRIDQSRVAVVKTGRNRKPMVVGYVNIGTGYFCPADVFEQHRDKHLVPQGSRYYANDRGKWFYDLWDAEECEPYPLPADAVRHGRSWCEF